MPQSPYRKRVLEYYQNPRHRGWLEAPDRVGEADNPVCGDTVQLALRLEDGERVTEAAFRGEGCIIAMAAASMFTEYIHGRTLEELRGLTDQDVLAMVGVELGWVRSQCALLALRALEMAIG